jgi:hypothetical protein
MGKLTTRQRRILIILGAANMIAVLIVLLVVLRTPERKASFSFSSPLTPQRVEACRKTTSDALLQTGHSGMVHTQQDGTILVQIQRPAGVEDTRLDMDASTWAALEAVTHGGECLRFERVQVTVDYPGGGLDGSGNCSQAHDENDDSGGENSACQALRATARVSMADLVLWSFGELDDDQLSMRLEYQLPEMQTPESRMPHLFAIKLDQLVQI